MPIGTRELHQHPTHTHHTHTENLPQRVKAANYRQSLAFVQKARVCRLQDKTAWNSSCVVLCTSTLPIALETREERRFFFVVLQELLSCLNSSFTLPWMRLHSHSRQTEIDFTRMPVKARPFGHKGHRKSVISIMVFSVVVTQIQRREETVWDI